MRVEARLFKLDDGLIRFSLPAVGALIGKKVFIRQAMVMKMDPLEEATIENAWVDNEGWVVIAIETDAP